MPPNFSQEDKVVVVMGPTGSGKSTLIELATGQDCQTIGHGLQSYTEDIRSVRVMHPTHNYPVVFVDTPGFDDTYRPDIEILTLTARFLVNA